jgi:hypothetical protein
VIYLRYQRLGSGPQLFDCRADDLYTFSAMRESRPRNKAP